MQIIKLPNISKLGIHSPYTIFKYISFQLHFVFLNISIEKKTTVEQFLMKNRFSIGFAWYKSLLGRSIILQDITRSANLTVIPNFYEKFGITHALFSKILFKQSINYYIDFISNSVTDTNELYLPDDLLPLYLVINSNIIPTTNLKVKCNKDIYIDIIIAFELQILMYLYSVLPTFLILTCIAYTYYIYPSMQLIFI